MAKGTVNKVILVGRLGADVEVKHAANGTAVTQLSVATTERVPAGGGIWEDKPEWHRVTAFSKLAENCGTYLGKGSQIFVEGRLQTRQWEDAQGVKKYSTEIIARDIQFLGGNKDSGNSGTQQQSQPTEHNTAKQNGYAPNQDEADGIPF